MFNFHASQCAQFAWRQLANSEFRRGYRFATNGLTHLVTVQQVMEFVAQQKLGHSAMWTHVVLFWGDRPLDPAAKMIDVIDGTSTNIGGIWLQGRIPLDRVKLDARPPPPGNDGLPEARLFGPTIYDLRRAAANASKGSDKLAAASVIGEAAIMELLQQRDADPFGTAHPREAPQRSTANRRRTERRNRASDWRHDQHDPVRPRARLVPAATLQRNASRSPSRRPRSPTGSASSEPRHRPPLPPSAEAAGDLWAKWVPTTGPRRVHLRNSPTPTRDPRRNEPSSASTGPAPVPAPQLAAAPAIKAEDPPAPPASAAPPAGRQLGGWMRQSKNSESNRLPSGRVHRRNRRSSSSSSNTPTTTATTPLRFI